MKKIRSILMIIIFILSVSISTLTNADFKVFHDGVIVGEANGHHFRPHEINGEGKFYCIWYGADYDPTFEDEAEYNQYYVGRTIPDEIKDNECIVNPEKPWDERTYLHYKNIGRIVDIEHQDVAYILANLPEDEMEAAKAIWDSSISKNPVGFDTSLSQESQAYSTFYDSIHDASGQDIYSSLISYDYSRVKVAVNQDDDTYVVGPFTVNYPQGSYNNKKFSWIKAVTAIDQDDSILPELQILDENGSLVYDTDRDGNNLNVPQNQRDFYIKFKSTTAMSVKLKVDFEYIESCSAEMYEYEGTRYKRIWKTKKRQCYSESHWNYETSSFNYVEEAYYELEETQDAKTQPLMAHVGTATMNRKDTSITIGGGGIDLTMNLEGDVFLDKDTGKTNTGNNQIDDGELLPGVEVRLYDVTTGGNQIRIALTDENGHYSFTRLNSQHKYFVRFTYNGMLYTNVAYSRNGDNTSKAIEDGQGNTGNRQNFNNKFEEIGSYPSNYQTVDCITGEAIYNKTYSQEDIASLFKQVSEEVVRNGGNEQAAYQTIINNNQNVPEIKEKVQYVADCRINAYTVEQYPLNPIFTTYYGWAAIAGVNYDSIYVGTYTQLHVNLGIKARTTFDMALYKDVYKAEMSINGKTETYNYDQTVTAKMGVSESDYLNGLRGMYQSNTSYTNAEKTGNIDTGEYTLDTRREEVANGQSSNYNLGNNEKGDYQLNNDYTNLNTDGTNKDERLKIFVTYKIAIVNQSATVGAITEIVDYFDTNYEFIDAYIGNENGVKIGNVAKSDNSRYSNTEYKSTGYKTIYLRPDVETRLDNGETQYMYVVLQLLGPLNDAGTLLSSKLLNNETFEVINLAEINGYKTYNSKTDNSTPGLVDIDSNPGNLNISNIDALTKENIINYPNIRSMYEDDTNRAPVLVYKTLESRTIAGTVFEDAAIGKDGKIWSDETIHTNETRQGNGQLDNNEKKIAGVKVELVEIKDIHNNGNEEMIVRSTTTTNSDGWYGFIGFLPGNYTVRYTYGSDDATAMNKTSTWYKGLNDTSYNGQDYQSTIFTEKGNAKSTESYQGENIFKYNNGESPVYWYTDTDNTNNPRYSDAQDDANRVKEVIYYSKEEYDKEITNHKAEVFNAYVNPQQSHINEQQNRILADELERRTYRYAYTPEMEVEIEYAKTETEGNIAQKHKIEGVDFGIVERPRSELVIDQDIARIKVVAADGVTVLFDSDGRGTTSNLQWVKEQEGNLRGTHYWGGKINGYGKQELVNIIMDEELISGAKLEVTYKFTVTNNGEQDGDSTTRAKNIVNYVSNNLDFDVESNKVNGKEIWKVVKVEDIQTDKNSTYINNKAVDLSTQSVILQTTEDNPLTKALAPGKSTDEVTLTLTKMLSAESTLDDLTYTNLAEIVEIDNTVGRYDHEATPGNQRTDQNPTEHDAAGASKYDNGMGSPSNPNDPNDPNDPGNPPDGVIIITPPTGSNYIYYVIGITSAVILAAGVYLIKKFIIDRK